MDSEARQHLRFACICVYGSNVQFYFLGEGGKKGLWAEGVRYRDNVAGVSEVICGCVVTVKFLMQW